MDGVVKGWDSAFRARLVVRRPEDEEAPDFGPTAPLDPRRRRCRVVRRAWPRVAVEIAANLGNRKGRGDNEVQEGHDSFSEAA